MKKTCLNFIFMSYKGLQGNYPFNEKIFTKKKYSIKKLDFVFRIQNNFR